ncbi:9011_t:CDS:1, partial [Funneliformis geosporum]
IMADKGPSPISPIAKEIEEKAEQVKEKLKHVETKESNKLPTAAGKFIFIFTADLNLFKTKLKLNAFIEIEAEKKEAEK